MTVHCTVCAAHPGAFNQQRAAAPWPTTEIAGKPVHKACAHQAEHLIATVQAGGLTVTADGAATWTSNGRALFDDTLAILHAFGHATDATQAATAALQATQDADFAAAYRATQPAQPSPEQLAEMRAAFGTGVTVVDVITGRETHL